MKNSQIVTVSMKRIDICNLMLACTANAILIESDGRTAKKWRTLHDELKAALDAFDAEQDQ